MNPANAQTKPAATRVLRIAVIAGISLCPITLAANTWTEQSPAGPPSPRQAHAMAAVSGTDQIVLFGGDNSYDLYGDTWVYNVSANTWENTSPAGSPSGRIGHAMAAVSGTDQIVLFGGLDGGYDGETWVYDLGDKTWTQRYPEPPPAHLWPSPRFGHAMAAVSGTDQIVLFGGDANGYDGETWVYDFGDNTWTQQFPAGSTPSGRFFHAMAEVSGTHQFVLFGGTALFEGSGTYNGETWVYDFDANTWTQELPASTPSPRNFHGMAGVSGTDQIVLFGGADDGEFDGETWVYGLVANTWTKQSLDPTPSPRRQHGMAGVSGTGQIVLFGGRDDNPYGETWVYDAGVGTAPTLAGLKYYDADADGEHDAGEEGIEGWPIDFFVDEVLTTLSTTADGTFDGSFDPAEYTIAERASLDSRWIQTGNLLDQSNGNFLNADMTYTVLAETGGSYEGLNFGNLCVGPGGAPAGVGGTGYWTNKNGQSLIGADDIALLVALNLRNANGSHFVPANAAAVKTWLKSAKATNMAYMLSAQLAATELNVLNGFVSGTQLILAPGTSSANTNGFATLDSVRAEANTELGAHGLTKAPSSDRSYQEALKNALAIANLNQTFVQESAANCPAPF